MVDNTPMEFFPEAVTPIDPAEATDELLERVVQEAELPSLLVSLAHATGDLRLIAEDLRAPNPVAPAGVAPQGGMSEEAQAEARELIVDVLKEFRDSGSVVTTEPDDATLRRLFEFVAGPVSDDYLPLLRREFGLTVDEDPSDWSNTQRRDFSVAIIGAGMSGILAAWKLAKVGVNFTVYEKNAEVGGSWWENVYPGCRLDTSNFAYSYSFAQKADWTHAFVTQKEILEYFRDVSDRLGIRDRIVFEREAVLLEFDDETCTWSVTTVDPEGNRETCSFDAVISAVGQLNRPNIPDIPGLDRFKGVAFHTAQWRDDVSLKGARVAVVGTGASGFQVIPSIAGEVEHLDIYQRHAPWMTWAPRYVKPLRDGFRWLLGHVPYYHRWYRIYQFWTTLEARRPFGAADPGWPLTESVGAKNHDVREALAAMILSQYEDRPDLAAKVVPDYPPYAKRTLRDDGSWARVLHQPHVDLITERIREITENGIVTADGVEHPADVIIWGTGFRASDFLIPMVIRGRNGVDLHEQWGGDARAYLGVAIPNFPNLFLVYGPNTGLLLTGSIILMSEMATDYIVSSISLLLSTGADALEIKEDIFNEFNEWVDEGNKQMAWGAAEVSSWYKNKFGRVAANWPFSILEYWNLTRRAQADHYERIFARNAPASERAR